MRLLAAVIALICCAAEGFRRSAALKERAVFLSGISQMLNGFLIEIRCSGSTLDELISRADGRFADSVRDCFTDGGSARSAWEQACRRLPKSGERTLLSELGQSLGTSDREGTLRLIELYAERFSALESEARAAYLQKGKAVVQVGALCGIAAAILII